MGKKKGLVGLIMLVPFVGMFLLLILQQVWISFVDYSNYWNSLDFNEQTRVFFASIIFFLTVGGVILLLLQLGEWTHEEESTNTD